MALKILGRQAVEARCAASKGVDGPSTGMRLHHMPDMDEDLVSILEGAKDQGMVVLHDLIV